MHDAAARIEEEFARITVLLVLLNRVGSGLLGQAVLKLERGNGQPINERAQVERAPGFLSAVA